MTRKVVAAQASLCVVVTLAACASTQGSKHAEPGTTIANNSCAANNVTLKVDARVDDRPTVEGTVHPPCARGGIVVHPLNVSEFWVQAMPTVRGDGAWILKPYIGRGGQNYGEQFEIVAIANPKEDLKEGEVLTRWPDAEAKSDVALVLKMNPTETAASTLNAPTVVPTPSPSPQTGNAAQATPTSSDTPVTANTPQNTNIDSDEGKKGECEPASGDIDADTTWGSGYIDLNALTNFSRGATLRLRIGGTARNILVRLLPDRKSPDQPVGVLGKYAVPQDRILVVHLSSAQKAIKQISVHGGPKAWRWFLGAGNGPATLDAIEVCQ